MTENQEGLNNGIKFEWLQEGRIAAFYLTNTAPETIDTWYRTSTDIIQQWPETKPYLVFTDMTNLGLTPYARQRTEELAATIPKYLSGRVAVLISRGVLGYGLRMFGSTRLKALVPNLSFEFFFEEAKALEWLEESL